MATRRLFQQALKHQRCPQQWVAKTPSDSEIYIVSGTNDTNTILNLPKNIMKRLNNTILKRNGFRSRVALIIVLLWMTHRYLIKPSIEC